MNVIALQRNNQKVLEESPSIAIGSNRNRVVLLLFERWSQLVRMLERLNSYYDEGKGEFYFMKWIPVCKVEHPVTEFVTGVDIVKEQIKKLQLDKYPLLKEDIVFKGHAIECRINAEKSFL